MSDEGSPEQARSDRLAEAAYRDALDLLERRPLTRSELRDRLGDRGHAGEATARAIERLRRAGWVDDQRLAVHFIATRAGRLGHGPRRLIDQLCARGLEREQAERAWRSAVDEGEVDPVGMLRHEIDRRLRREAAPLDRRRYRRVYNALLRAGYRADRIEEELGAPPAAEEVDDEFA